jgi:3-hydroxyacyl-CoA dehydrogenase
MKLLEVVKGNKTSLEAISACMQVGKKMKKVPVLAGNCFGFIGNRMLEFYGKEAQFLVEEGASPAQVELLSMPSINSLFLTGRQSPKISRNGDGIL